MLLAVNLKLYVRSLDLLLLCICYVASFALYLPIPTAIRNPGNQFYTVPVKKVKQVLGVDSANICIYLSRLKVYSSEREKELIFAWAFMEFPG